ncbi:hypothetical protein M9H77_02384 [Catharanthus roseus]|uniref:Uncharacterized protein n=1 Tax=Catharanthus roseus TaxID=4058 RepID=A0ACC0C889_CATRO|nr:hypothetical protein M9H77_02384 [Catharanthus roseus]
MEKCQHTCIRGPLSLMFYRDNTSTDLAVLAEPIPVLQYDSPYKVKKEPLEAWILGAFIGSETNDDLILCARGFNFLLIGGHMLLDFSGNLVHWRLRVWDNPAVDAEVLSFPSDEYIRWYRGITWVYICNPANRDIHLYGYQPAGVDRRMVNSMLQEVDDMALVVIQEPPTDPSQMTVFAKKVQTIIQRYMVPIGSTLGCTPLQRDIQQTFLVQPSCRRPQEHVSDRGACGVKRGARRQPGRGAGGGRLPVPPFPHRYEHVDPVHVEVERGEGFGGGQPTVDPSCTPPPGTAGSSTPHQPLSQASSSDEEERADDMDGVQHYGFGHCVGKKTTRFTPSD